MMLLIALLACHGSSSNEREPGQRAPLTLACDPQDEVECLLPWPSSRYSVLDDSTGTGIRLAIEPASLPGEDDPTWLNIADGASRIGAVATAFETRLDEDTLGALHVFVAEPGTDWGEEIPLYTERVVGGSGVSPRDLLIGRPRAPMPAASEHLAVILDDLQSEDGALSQGHLTAVALGLEEPADDDESAWADYNAPARALLEDLDIDPAHVLRMWDFTTRSQDDPWRRLDAIKAADKAVLDAGGATVIFDKVQIAPRSGEALVAEGRLLGLPEYRTDDGSLRLDADRLAMPMAGTRTAWFRIVLPAGSGDWPVALYGHGTGGNYTDSSFDQEIASNGLAKLGVQWEGWTEDDVIFTFANMASAPIRGTELSTAGLLMSVANAHAFLQALDGPLGDALSAESIGGLPNPAVGRRPDTREPVWVGGSMGGTMGAVVSLSSDRVRFGVLNVPGGGWTHFVSRSSLYLTLEGAVLATFGDEVPAALALLMSQPSWDEVDGAAWADKRDGDVYLLQESIGDPVLPNIGTEILGNSLGATLLNPSLEPIPGLDESSGPIVGATGLEQFRVPDTGDLDVHGFAGRNTPAGDAALQQILEFLTTALDGQPVIEHPSDCDAATESGACDFENAW